MWVKICANTTLEDAACARALGADAVGFVFAKSKRQVMAPQVAAITAALPKTVERIGVFDSQNAADIAANVSAAGLTGIQLHGGYDEALVRNVRGFLSADISIIQTLHWNVTNDAQFAAEKLESELDTIAKSGLIDRVLVDSKVNGASGGTGVSFDWTSARKAFENSPLQLILAGGLRPENVAEAIAQLHPWGVDVASGVEAEVGRKNPDRVAEFIQRARAAQKL